MRGKCWQYVGPTDVRFYRPCYGYQNNANQHQNYKVPIKLYNEQAASRRVHDEYRVRGIYPMVYVLGENNIVRYKHFGFASFEELSRGLEIV